MPIEMNCPNCDKVFSEIPDTYVGKKVKCRCGTSFLVSSAEHRDAQPSPDVRKKDLSSVANSDFYGIVIWHSILLFAGLLLLVFGCLLAIMYFDALRSISARVSPPSIWQIISAIYMSLTGLSLLFVAAFLKLGLAIHLNLRKIANRE